MNEKTRLIISLVFLVIFGAGALYMLGFFSDDSILSVDSIQVAFTEGEYDGEFSDTVTFQPPAIESLSPFTNKYVSEQYSFSFNYPEDYTSSNFKEPIGENQMRETILVQNVQKKEGFQVLITPFNESGATLTSERIRRDIPDLEIRQEQEVLLGSVGKGIAFLSDNEAFGGASREVWFIIGGNLYQISTYASQEKLLQEMLATWKFE
ncbi:MAG: hypothetical protein WDZ88_01675 [Candidatus Paceibacterota bacterium]